MGKRMPIFYSALLLTGVNLLLRFISTAFSVYLSGRIGAAGIGLLQLVLSVGGLALTIGMGGIRTATMYLSAEVVGQKRTENMVWVLSGCVMYSLLFSVCAGCGLYLLAPKIAVSWVGDTEVIGAIRLLACFLPVNCLCGVMIGYFTGTNRIGELAMIEVCEQLLSMIVTVLLLTQWAGHNTAKGCLAVIMGSGMGGCFTLCVLLVRSGQRKTVGQRKFSLRKKILETALPLALGDTMKAGITTTENVMVPKRLMLYPGETEPLAAFGIVCGMVFPVLMFPAAILFGLAELLIPELARCNASDYNIRIRYLAQRSLLVTLIYGCFCGGILYLAAEPLCVRLYNTQEAGIYLKWFAVLAPMLYCDVIVDAISKGLGKQKISVRYNIITSLVDVLLLFILLPKYGMKGYFISFLVSHLINFLLSIRLVHKSIGAGIPVRTTCLCSGAVIISVLAGKLSGDGLGCYAGFLLAYIALIMLTGTIKPSDIKWLKGLILSK